MGEKQAQIEPQYRKVIINQIDFYTSLSIVNLEAIFVESNKGKVGHEYPFKDSPFISL